MSLYAELERHLIHRRLQCKQIDTDKPHDSYEEMSKEALYDAIVYAAAAYVEAGRENDKMSSLERKFLETFDFMEADTDEKARQILRKQRGLDDNKLILFVLKHHDSIEGRHIRYKTAISTLWHILEWRTSYAS